MSASNWLIFYEILPNICKQVKGNNIDDEGVGALTGAISGSQLVELFLTRNPTITIRGWERLSTLLEMPDSKLEKLYLSGNNIGDEVARIFANALRGNSKLKCLTVNNCRFTTEGCTSQNFSVILPVSTKHTSPITH